MNPDIYYYNPTCELAVANGSENYQAKALLKRFERDLDIIPAFIARSEDITLVYQMPSNQFIDDLNKAGIEISGLTLLEDSLNDASFAAVPKGILHPWGWSPAVHKLLGPLKASCSKEFHASPVSTWRPVHKELYSRIQSVKIVSSIVTKNEFTWMPRFEDLPRVCKNHDEIIDLQHKWSRIVVKSPFSSSGRGLQVLRHNEYNDSNRQVISGFFNQEGYVIAEPWFDKLLDLSFQFFSYGNGDIEFKGVTTFLTDKSGKYNGSYIEELPGKLPQRLKQFIDEHIGMVKDILISELKQSLYSTEYYSWLGVDAIVYNTINNTYLFHPCLEINCRYTMGAVTLALRNHLADGSGGVFRIIYRKDKSVLDFFKEMKIRYPLSMNNRKIEKGFLPLTEATNDSLFGAYIIISD